MAMRHERQGLTLADITWLSEPFTVEYVGVITTTTSGSASVGFKTEAEASAWLAKDAVIFLKDKTAADVVFHGIIRRVRVESIDVVRRYDVQGS